MTNNPSAQLIEAIITIEDSQLNDEQLQNSVNLIRQELIDAKLVKEADLIPIDSDLVPENAKSLGGFVKGAFKAIAEITKLKPLVEGLGNNLFGKIMTIEFEKKDLIGRIKKYKIEYRRLEDLPKIMAEIEKIMNS